MHLIGAEKDSTGESFLSQMVFLEKGGQGPIVTKKPFKSLVKRRETVRLSGLH